MRDPHAHGDIEWNYLVDGDFLYSHGGQQWALPRRRLILFWAGVPHQALRVSPDIEMLIGVMPLARLLAWELPASLVQRLLSGECLVADPDETGDDERQLQRWVEDLDSGRADARAQDLVALELQARLQRLARRPGDQLPVAQPPPIVADLLTVLTERYAEITTIAALAGEIGCHPKYAFAAFKRYTGMTPARFLLAYRIAQAQRLLLSADLTVAAAGRAVGFRGEATFHQAFKRQTGSSPAVWRRRLRVAAR